MSASSPAQGPPHVIRILHTSDLHIGERMDDDLASLRAVIECASRNQADCVLLAGDIFDHNSVDGATLSRVASMLDVFHAPVIILPGNHDALVPNSVYERMPQMDRGNVTVLGTAVGDAVVIPALDLEVTGEAHRGSNYSPFRIAQRPRTTRHQVFMAHGQLLREERDRRRSWVFTLDEVRACNADYVALGHWDTQMRLADDVAAYYSGSPRSAGSALLVTLGGREPEVLVAALH